MSLRATSHSNLQCLSSPKPLALDNGIYKSFSLSSSNMNGNGGGGGRIVFGKGQVEEVKGFSTPHRRPVRAVRPVSAHGVNVSGSFLQINHLQGELVRKRKECEDLKKENKYLSNEIHMERIMMRTENELTMRNLRNLNQELQAQVKELKNKVYLAQQRATLCTRVADEATDARGEAEKHRALAEARAHSLRQDRELTEADRSQLSEDLLKLKRQHQDAQLLLAQTEKNYFETRLKLDRISGEKQALLEENRCLEGDRDALRHKLRQVMDENTKVNEKEVRSRHRALVAEEQSEKDSQAKQEANQERRLVEKERQERTTECLNWREKHQALADIFKAQEDLKSQRQSKACQATIKSFFLCMTENDQRVTILKNHDGTPRNFTEGDPIFISTPEHGAEDADKSSSRSMFRVSAPRVGKDLGPSHFGDLSPGLGGEHEVGHPRRSRKTVEYFWIPTDEE